jgi:hypothetical protein
MRVFRRSIQKSKPILGIKVSYTQWEPSLFNIKRVDNTRLISICRREGFAWGKQQHVDGFRAEY